MFASAFAANTAATAELARQRQDTRSAKESDVCISGTVETFVTSQGEGNATRNSSTYTPPEAKTRKTRDGKKSYAVALSLNVRVGNIKPVPGEMEAEPNAPPGVFRSRVKVGYIGADPKDPSKIDTGVWLRANAAAIWKSDHPDSLRMREYVTADGTLTAARWWRLSVGDMIKIKVPDQKDGVFRKKNPRNPTVPLVQPSTPVNFLAIARDIYVSIKPRPVPEVKEGEPPVQPEEGDLGMVMQVSPTYTCKGGAVLDEDYDPNMAQTERLHEQQTPHKHNLVPYDVFRKNSNVMPTSTYFYVGKTTEPRPISALDPDDTPCVVVVRDTNPDTADFISTFNGETRADCRVRFHVYQYTAGDAREALRTGKPECMMRNRYIIEVRAGGSQQQESVLWRGYGIPDLEHYGLIVGANPELMVHIHARLWSNKSMEHATNAPELRNKGDGMQNVQGYYYYFASSLTVDFLRYFRTMGVRVSPQWVGQEFSYWQRLNPRTQKSTYALAPYPDVAAKQNPVNANGLISTVLSLGNGWHPDVDNPDESKRQVDAAPDMGRFHAFQGDIGAMIDNGTHDFFILTSKGIGKDVGGEAWARGADAPFADAWIDAQRTNHKIYYWIYAVRKDAKMARDFHPASANVVEPYAGALAASAASALPPAKQLPSLPNEHGKRAREEDEHLQDDEEEVYDSNSQ
jgi:hypothetical protein